MAGIYGNHPEDRYFSRELHEHLNEEAADELEQEAARFEAAVQRRKDALLDDLLSAEENLGDC